MLNTNNSLMVLSDNKEERKPSVTINFCYRENRILIGNGGQR